MVFHKYLASLIILAISCSGCGIQVKEIGATTPTAFIITLTLPPTLSPPPSETPLPPPPQPTASPVEGTSSTQINVRSEPSSVSDVLGIIPANTKVQIVGKDPGENWWQILYPQGKDGKGWVTAQYVTTPGKPEVPVIGGGVLNPNNGNTAIIQQQLNIRSGPGTDFNSIGTLNAQDVVNLTGKDANGAWLQIEFTAGPDGKGWINAAFAQAQGVENLPIVTEAGLIVGTGTPTDIPPTPTATILPAWHDNDSQDAPVVNVKFDPAGTKALIYNGEVSAPAGDMEDWVAFMPYAENIFVSLECKDSDSLLADISENTQPMNVKVVCGDKQKKIDVKAGSDYLIHFQAERSSSSVHTINYTITITMES